MLIKLKTNKKVPSLLSQLKNIIKFGVIHNICSVDCTISELGNTEADKILPEILPLTNIPTSCNILGTQKN